jgi:hypothetical protein
MLHQKGAFYASIWHLRTMKTFRFLMASCLCALMLTACVSRSDITRANYAITSAWQKEYEAVIRDLGHRIYAVPPKVAYAAMKSTFQNMGMILIKEDSEELTLVSTILDSRLFTEEEWQAIKDVELPKMREILAADLGGAKAAMFTLTIGKQEILFGAEIDRMRQSSSIQLALKPHRLPYHGRRGINPLLEELEPSSVRLALAKVWLRFEEELKRRGHRLVPAPTIDDEKA